MNPRSVKQFKIRWLTSKIGSGKTPTGGGEAYVEDGIAFLRSQNINHGRLLTNDLAKIDENTHREMYSTRVLPGDVLLNITGASLGRAAPVPDGFCEANVNQHVCILRPDGHIESRFLYYAITSRLVQDQILSIQVGGNRDGLNFEQVGNLRVPLPPIEEQRRISDFLDAATGHIDQLLELDRKMESVLDERTTVTRDRLIDKLRLKFGEAPLRRYLRRIEQGTSPQCDNSARDRASQWAVLKLSAIKKGTFQPTENKRLPDDVNPAPRYEIRKGDLLVTRANTPELVGDVAVVPEVQPQLLLPDLIYRLFVDGPVLPEFIAEVALGSRIRQHIQMTARGSSQSMVKLRGEDIRDWPIPRAESAAQYHFITEIQEITSLTRQLQRALSSRRELLEEKKRTLITAAVTGEFDVSSASGRG